MTSSKEEAAVCPTKTQHCYPYHRHRIAIYTIDTAACSVMIIVKHTTTTKEEGKKRVNEQLLLEHNSSDKLQ